MPTYEYACTDCGQHLEVVQGFADEPLATCGVCGGTLRKVFHPAGVLFRGSGFYSTDNRSSKGSGESTSGAGEGKPGAGEGKPGAGEGKPGAGEGKPGGQKAATTKEKTA